MALAMEIPEWAQEQFGTCELGDRRRTKRLVKFASQAAAMPVHPGNACADARWHSAGIDAKWILKAWLRCPKRMKTAASGSLTARGRMHLWRTVGPDIPCQVASQQSLTPFLRAASTYRRPNAMTRTFGHRSHAFKIQELPWAYVGARIPRMNQKKGLDRRFVPLLSFLEEYPVAGTIGQPCLAARPFPG